MYRVILDLTSATMTTTGLTVHCELDASHYPKGIAVSDEQFASLNITRHDFHGEWDDNIRSRNITDEAVIP